MVTLRNRLREFEADGRTSLYSTYQRMYDIALAEWLPDLGSDEGSHQGIPHIRSVESNIDALASDDLKLDFTPNELFILLASILLHDIGKVMNLQSGTKTNHHLASCLCIQRSWGHLGLPDERVARWCALLACSHDWSTPEPTGEELTCQYRGGECRVGCWASRGSELMMDLNTGDGPVRLMRLAALLRIGDQVDNRLSRSVAAWLRANPPENPVTGKVDQQEHRMTGRKEWRGAIQWIAFDRMANCILYQCTQKQFDELQPELKRGLTSSLTHTNEVLANWRRPLLEMGLRYERAYIELLTPHSVLLDPADAGDRGKLEPALSLSSLRRVCDAMRRLDRGVIGSEAFTWRALAGESGIEDTGLVRLAVQRLRAILQVPEYYGYLSGQRGGAHAEPVTEVCRGRAGDDSLLVPPGKILIAPETWQIYRDPCGLGERGRATSDDRQQGAAAPDDDSQKRVVKPAREHCHPNVISTGLGELDDLLPGPDRQPSGGFAAPRHGQGSARRWLAPIVFVEGRSGLGKTVLALQIASGLAQSQTPRWLCVYYPLEQTASGLLLTLEQFQWADPASGDGAHLWNLNEMPWYTLRGPDDGPLGRLAIARLSPLDDAPDSPGRAFNQRLGELRQAIQWAKGGEWIPSGSDSTDWECFFLIDSLNAFSNTPPAREQLHRLFRLFREAEVPMLMTHESQESARGRAGDAYVHDARYLADVVIKLDATDSGGYFRQTIEIVKSRYGRRVLGKHQMKVKGIGNNPTASIDDRRGIVIYPSIHRHLSRAQREQKPIQPKNWPVLFDADALPIHAAVEGNTPVVKSDSCMVVAGPHGAHKFALAMNLLLCHSPGAGRKKLIVSLAEEADIALSQVALFPTVRGAWRDYLARMPRTEPDVGKKIERIEFGAKDREAAIVVVNFRMGEIMPEEFLYVLGRILDDNTKNGAAEGSAFDALLFADTAQLRTRFPGLAQDKLFLPVLVDTAKRRGLFSVLVDIHDEDGRPSPALLAAADCRIFVEKGENIYVRVNNVRGKYYEEQERREIHVVRSEGQFELQIQKSQMYGQQ